MTLSEVQKKLNNKSRNNSPRKRGKKQKGKRNETTFQGKRLETTPLERGVKSN